MQLSFKKILTYIQEYIQAFMMPLFDFILPITIITSGEWISVFTRERGHVVYLAVSGKTASTILETFMKKLRSDKNKTVPETILQNLYFCLMHPWLKQFVTYAYVWV